MPPMRANPKIGFYLVTADEKELPALPQGNGRLSAHRLLRIRKVANYVVQKLELELPLLTDAAGSTTKTGDSDEKETPNGNGNGTENSGTSSSESEGSEKSEERIPPEQYVDILCNNKVLSPTHSLATVKAFFWKSGDDIVLNYRINQKYADAEKHKNSPRTKKSSGAAKIAGEKKQQVANALRKNNPFHRGK
jgi:WD repeat-containing protein 48